MPGCREHGTFAFYAIIILKLHFDADQIQAVCESMPTVQAGLFREEGIKREARQIAFSPTSCASLATRLPATCHPADNAASGNW